MKKRNLAQEMGFENSSSNALDADVKRITNKVINNINIASPYNERKVDIMTNKKRFALIGIAAVLVLGITAFAAEYGDNIIKMITTGYNRYVQVDPEAPHMLSEELKGKIFDENGVMLESLTVDDVDNMYNANGEKITQEMFAGMIAEMTGGLVEVSDGYDVEDKKVYFESLEDAQKNAVFDIKTPEYMVEGYSLSKIYAFKDSDGSVSGEYRNLVYKNAEGKEIYIYERLLNENTAFETGTDGTLEEITINGQKGIIMDDKTLDFETEDNVSVSISTRGNTTKDELIKIAESVK